MPGESMEFVPAMEEVAREAGALIMEYFQQRVKVEYKGDVDLVTVADRKSEALILERIRSRWPSHDVLGEEGARIETGSEYKWTRIAGIVYDPTRPEMFAAEQGSGAYLNGQRIQVSRVSGLSESLVATGFPSHKRHKNPNIFFYHQITLRTHGVRRAGSAALDLASV